MLPAGQQLASVAAALTGELSLLPPPSLAYKLGKQMVTRMEEEHPVE